MRKPNNIHCFNIMDKKHTVCNIQNKCAVELNKLHVCTEENGK